MMLYPAMGELSAQIHNRYMLVNVVARRARQIAEAYEEAHQILDEKPVTMAINEVADGILEDPEQVQDAAETGDAAPDTGDDTDNE
ncbi:MAG: DNA-directed RNA polymerase subunit omega [Oscillibacter sp.]|nr:DNA-directed RNA polymerase subunit omega [Oscillibacter sp.]